jgi:hypothetical protein
LWGAASAPKGCNLETLDQYLTSQYLGDQQELVRLQRTINDTSATLVRAFKATGWPYRLKRGAERLSEERPPSQLSHSTTAMVTMSLVKLVGAWKRPAGLRQIQEFPPPPVQLEKELSKVIQQATNLLLKALTSGRLTGTHSGTYGPNDPLTLSFVADFLAVPRRNGDPPAWKDVEKYLKHRCRQLRALASKKGLVDHKPFFEETPTDYREIVSNSIIPLRIVQATRLVNPKKEIYLPEFRRYFETTLHDHLSFSSIPDSRFDPAELTFCLEGLLLTQFTAVDRSLVRRVIEVLSVAQRENAFWRPTKPFISHKTRHVPLSSQR